MQDKLLNELPGILNWCLQGCLDWQKNGMQVPDAVLSATRQYREDEDVVQLFLDDCCKVDIDNKQLSDSLSHLWNVLSMG